MPFVNIRILKGHPQERKDEIARRVTETICEVAKLPKEAVWVVFEDVTADDWYVGQTRVERAAEEGGPEMSDTARRSIERRDPRQAVRDRRRRTVVDSSGWPPASCSPRGRCGTHARSICSSATCRAITCADGARRTASPRSASRATSRTDSPGTGRAGCSSASTRRATSRAPRPTADHGARQPPRRQGAEQPQRSSS